MRRDERRIEGLTAWDIALVRRVARGGSVAPDERLRFASEVDDLDGWLGEDDDGEPDEDLPPIRCDGSVCSSVRRPRALLRYRHAVPGR